MLKYFNKMNKVVDTAIPLC